MAVVEAVEFADRRPAVLFVVAKLFLPFAGVIVRITSLHVFFPLIQELKRRTSVLSGMRRCFHEILQKRRQLGAATPTIPLVFVQQSSQSSHHVRLFKPYMLHPPPTLRHTVHLT